MTTIIDNRLDLDTTLVFNNSFRKEDYYKIPPVNGVENVNRAGNITFRCNIKESFLALFDSLIRVKLELKGIGDTMNLEHNAILRMFESAKIMFGSNDIESISAVVGEATTMINFITMSHTYRETYGAISGWFPDNHKDADKTKNSGYLNRTNFYTDGVTLMIPLKLIFGFTDYRKIIHYIDSVSLILNRKSDATINDQVFFGTAKVKNAANVDINPGISFSEMEWWIPTYTLNIAAETFYAKRLSFKTIF
jgi:hypothetical protein